MLKIIRNNEKKFLAGFTILLTLTFVVSSGTGRGSGRGSGGTDNSVGSLAAGKDLRASEINSARAELEAVQRNIVVIGRTPSGQLARADAIAGLLNIRDGSPVATALHDRPELFALLRREAEAAGVRADPDEVNAAMVAFNEETPFGANRYVGPSRDAEPDAYNATAQGLSDLLAVRQNFERIVAAVKVSRPAVANAAVKGVGGSAGSGGEQVQFNLVNLAAADYLPAVPAPTTQQCQAQFDQFAGVTPDHPSKENPFGFGYKLPVRLTAQYVRLTPEAVEAAVAAGRTAYDWEVAARQYYLTHPAEFQLTAGVTAGGPTTAPAGGGVKPFEAVRKQATDAVQNPLVVTLTGQVRQFLTTRLTQDWQASRDSATPTAYSAPDYLHGLADQVAKRFPGVVLLVVDLPPDQTVAQVDAASELSLLRAPGNLTFGSVLAQHAVDFLDAKAAPGKSPTDPAVRAILTKPTPLLTSMLYAASLPGGVDLGEGPVAIGRLTAALPSQPPPDLAAVRPAVEADCRSAAAYDRAKADAEQVLTAAQDGRMAAGAAAIGRTPVATAALSYATAMTAAVPQLPPDLSGRFVKEAYDQLLAGYVPAPGKPEPAALIAMPDVRRVSVAQLFNVSPTWSAATVDRTLLAAAATLQQTAYLDLTAGWYDADAVIARLGYKPFKDGGGQ